MMTKLLPTSTAGSLPKPSWLAEPEKLWSPWLLEGEDLVDVIGGDDADGGAVDEGGDIGTVLVR
jgi:hypothetical protein